jgi:hypothetical protein
VIFECADELKGLKVDLFFNERDELVPFDPYLDSDRVTTRGCRTKTSQVKESECRVHSLLHHFADVYRILLALAM